MLVVVSTFMSLWTRKISLINKNVFFTTGLLNYLIVAIVGVWLSLAYNNFSLPTLPSGNLPLYLVGVGFFIPLSWLAQYKLVYLVGAANGAIATTISYITSALFGFLFLAEGLTVTFGIGSILLVTATYISLTIRADQKHKTTNKSRSLKIFLVLVSSLALALGLLFEKHSVDVAGYWNYLFYGWTMQLLGASVIWLIFGRKELKQVNKRNVLYGLSLGLVVSLSGTTFVYALSKGTLSATVMVTSAKITLTVVPAAVFLKERNELTKRLVALALAIVGLSFILW